LGLNFTAFVYYALGDLDSYFAYLNQALDGHSIDFMYIAYCPLFAEGRADPRYQALVEKMRKRFWP
jgi:hypothetical protein